MSPLRKFEQMCLDNLKKRIRLPERNYHVVNENNMRFCYIIDHTEIKYITFPSREHAMEFFKANGKISSVVFLKDEVKMYREVFRTVTINRHNAFRQEADVEEVKWEEVYFSREEVLEICARYEFEGIGGITGHCLARIVPFTTPLLAA